MTPREWVGCVVGVRGETRGPTGYATIRRAWRRKRDGRLTRVVLVWGSGAEREVEHHYRVLRVERLRGEAPSRVLVLGGAW